MIQYTNCIVNFLSSINRTSKVCSIQTRHISNTFQDLDTFSKKGYITCYSYNPIRIYLPRTLHLEVPFKTSHSNLKSAFNPVEPFQLEFLFSLVEHDFQKQNIKYKNKIWYYTLLVMPKINSGFL